MAAAIPGVSANPYPQQTIKIIVPFPAGSGSDTVTRIVAEHLKAELNASIVIENRPGSTGQTGSLHLKDLVPDGYTLGSLASSAIAGVPALKCKAGFTPDDFSLIAGMGEFGWVLLGTAKEERTLAELLSHWKKAAESDAGSTKARILIGYGGPLGQLSALELKAASGLPLENIFYRGEPAMHMGLMSGEVHLAFSTLASSIGKARDGVLKPLVIVGDERHPLLPNVPTMKEVLPEFRDTVLTQNFVAPLGLPEAISEKIRDALKKVLSNPTVIRELSEKAAFLVKFQPPDRLRRDLRQEYDIWKGIMQESNIPCQ
jgi:tripartite-type tricarboxylate transporter receptor subunit TctC